MQTPQYFHFMFISELEDDRFSMRPLSTEHLCGQLEAKVNCCPLHRKKTLTGRSILKPSTSGGMVHLTRSSFSMSATSEMISFSSGSERRSLSRGESAVFGFLLDPLPAPASSSSLLHLPNQVVNAGSNISLTSKLSLHTQSEGPGREFSLANVTRL